MEGKEIFGLEKRGESFITKNRCDIIKRQYISCSVGEMGIK